MKAMLFIVKLGVTIIGHFILAVIIGAALLFTLGSGLIEGRLAESSMGVCYGSFARLLRSSGRLLGIWALNGLGV